VIARADRHAGIDVQLSRASSGSAVASAVAGGSVDIGKSSIVSIVTAHAKGLPFVWIAPGSMYVPAAPDGGLIVAANSLIKTGRDLNGKIVATPVLGDLNTIATRAWVDQNGGDSKQIQFVEVPVAAQAAALDEGRIAAGGIINPFLGEALASGKTRFLAPFYSAIANRFMLSGWFTTVDFAATHRDAIASFQRTSIRRQHIQTRTTPRRCRCSPRGAAFRSTRLRPLCSDSQGLRCSRDDRRTAALAARTLAPDPKPYSTALGRDSGGYHVARSH
jgi:ABC-type nitrate/sulfonate/bicarbonate transport system substrate-binding protein